MRQPKANIVLIRFRAEAILAGSGTAGRERSGSSTGSLQ